MSDHAGARPDRVKPSLTFISAPPLANKHDATITAAIDPDPFVIPSI